MTLADARSTSTLSLHIPSTFAVAVKFSIDKTCLNIVLYMLLSSALWWVTRIDGVHIQFLLNVGFRGAQVRLSSHVSKRTTFLCITVSDILLLQVLALG